MGYPHLWITTGELIVDDNNDNIELCPTTKKAPNVKKDASNGRFVKGNKSGGRPVLPKEMVELCRAFTPEAIKILMSIAKNTKSAKRERIMASTALLDRAYGKPYQMPALAEGSELTTPQVVVTLTPDEYKKMKAEQDSKLLQKEQQTDQL